MPEPTERACDKALAVTEAGARRGSAVSRDQTAPSEICREPAVRALL